MTTSEVVLGWVGAEVLAPALAGALRSPDVQDAMQEAAGEAVSAPEVTRVLGAAALVVLGGLALVLLIKR